MKLPVNEQVVVLGTGSYLPERVITNEVLRDLCASGYDEEQSGDFSTWVDRVTHIHERRFIDEGQTAGHLGAEAAKHALEMAGVRPTDLDLIIHASFTPSVAVPGDHVNVAKFIGADATPSFTLTGACAGSIQGMAMAYGMLASGTMDRILVVGAETISPVIDFSDPLTAILFADGAGAVLMGRVDSSDGGMCPPSLGFDYNWENIVMENANMPFNVTAHDPMAEGRPPLVERTYVQMRSGPSVLRNAVNIMANSSKLALGSPDKEQFKELTPRLRVIPHQANGRIVDGITKKLRMDPLKVLKTVHNYGNISAASNLIALDYAVRKGNMVANQDPETGKIHSVAEVDDPLQRGEVAVLPSIGAGYLFGAVAFVNTI
jgi:3-oxoacyl-[acyl-carrier-protein] synthase-3